MRNFFKTSELKRRTVQILSLAVLGEWSFYGIFRCPFAVPYIGCGECPVIQCPGRSLWMWGWILIGVSALFFGRAFCGWVCPGGLLAEILAMGTRLQVTLHGMWTKILSTGKYVMLALSLYFFFLLQNPRWAIPIRTGEFFNSVWLTFEHANMLWIYKTAGLLVLFFIGGIIIPRIWCRFLCPTGGLLDIINRVALIKIVRDAGCRDCETCLPSCTMGTRAGETNCTNCGSCISHCPAGAVHYSRLPRKEQVLH